MDKITIRICLGTTCHLMGSSYLQTLEQDMPENLREKIRIEWSRCLGYCKDENYGSAPFVIVEGELVEKATAHDIIRKVEELLN
ncbi:MAG: NAD(P)H-dependent oxidoreductase subunit E [Chitinispirillaceae bacterium]